MREIGEDCKDGRDKRSDKKNRRGDVSERGEGEIKGMREKGD